MEIKQKNEHIHIDREAKSFKANEQLFQISDLRKLILSHCDIETRKSAKYVNKYFCQDIKDDCKKMKIDIRKIKGIKEEIFFDFFEKYPNLEDLTIKKSSREKIDDEFIILILKHLEKLQSLNSLALHNSSLQKKEVSHCLKNLNQLKNLSIVDSLITDEVIQNIPKSTNIETIILQECRYTTGAAWEHMTSFEKLKKLKFQIFKKTDEIFVNSLKQRIRPELIFQPFLVG